MSAVSRCYRFQPFGSSDRFRFVCMLRFLLRLDCLARTLNVCVANDRAVLPQACPSLRPDQASHCKFCTCTFPRRRSRPGRFVSTCSNLLLCFRSVPSHTRLLPSHAIGSTPPASSRLALCDPPAPWPSLAPPFRAAGAHASSRVDVARSAPFVAEP